MPGFKLSVYVCIKSGVANQRARKDYSQLEARFLGVMAERSVHESGLFRMKVAPEEVSVDSVIASVISGMKSVSSLKGKQRTKGFLSGKDVFSLLPTRV